MNIKKNNNDLIILQTHNFKHKDTKKLNKTIYNTVLVNKKKHEQLYIYKEPTILSTNFVLELYNINSIDSLIEYIKEIKNNHSIVFYDSLRIKKYKSSSEEDEFPFETLNKVLTSWIIENFTILKNHKTVLNDVCYMLIQLTLPDNFISDELLRKNIKDYIIYWFEEKDINDFDFNLINDMNSYFYKKFKK